MVTYQACPVRIDLPALEERQLQALNKWPDCPRLQLPFIHKQHEAAPVWDAQRHHEIVLDCIGAGIDKRCARGLSYSPPRELLAQPPVKVGWPDPLHPAHASSSPCLLLAPTAGFRDAAARRSYSALRFGKGSEVQWRMHAYLCASRFGQPSKQQRMVIHSAFCGSNRHCVNPLHLRWGDAAANKRDERLAREIRSRRMAEVRAGKLR